MVQKTRLDLIGRPAGIVLALLLAVPAHAQNLLQDRPLLSSPPLTTLLQPQRLDRSKPIFRQDTARTPGQPGTPCIRAAPATSAQAGAPPGPPSAAASTPGRAATGGSGPGEYSRYMPGAATPSASPSASGAKPVASGAPAAAPAASAPTPPTRGVDKPLYGGIDRPLWNTGEERSFPGATPATAGDAAAADAHPAPTALPRDRPLWADSSPAQPGADATGAAAIAAAGQGLLPCRTNSAPLLR